MKGGKFSIEIIPLDSGVRAIIKCNYIPSYISTPLASLRPVYCMSVKTFGLINPPIVKVTPDTA